jgi:CubicO group peptidase (beta-lactamase class C family)
MRHCLLLLMPIFLFDCSFSQQSYSPAFDQLKEFEGQYQNDNNSLLGIAASPADNHLYAIIDDVKYSLSPVEKDIFQNTAGEKVRFLRNGKGTIDNCMMNGKGYRLIKKTEFDTRIWYPREPDKHNRFSAKRTQRPQLNDGIDIGSMGSSGIDKTRIQQMISSVIDGTYKDVHSILLIKNNKLVLEEYFYEYDRNDLHQLRSVTKSFISALIGIAMSKGLVKSIDDPVISFFPEYSLDNPSPQKSRITIRHLLTQTSGLDCESNSDSSGAGEIKMNNANDWVKFTLDLPMIDTPGRRFHYCPGGAITLGRIIEKVSGQRLEDFAKTNLFKPLGITNFKWEFHPDRSDPESFCQLYLRPRDMAKFGMLFMNNGQWQGKQIIPPGWINESLSKQSAINESDYGYLWWMHGLNADGKRYEGFAAQGNGGQRIFLFSKYHLIVVITAGNYTRESASDEMIIKHILPGLREEEEYR